MSVVLSLIVSIGLHSSAYGLDEIYARCQNSSYNVKEPCIQDITQWAKNDPMRNPYNCAAGPPFTVEEAAADCATVNAPCSRIRKNLYTLNDTELHIAMKALYCGQWWSNKHPESQNKSNYTENHWGYVSSFHGAPGWFKQCQNESNENYAKGIGPPGCCSHTNPNFVTFHRMLMVQYENSLRRWDLRFALPYWDWTNDPSVYISDIEYGLPQLLRNQTWYDVHADVVVSNPFFNYNSTDGPVNQYIKEMKNRGGVPFANKYTCDYVCKAEAPSLFQRANPYYPGGQTWFDQALQSMLTENLVVFDYSFEVPHNNIHNLLGGNMPDLWYDGVDPIFTFHHSQIERLFVIWQKMMEHRGIDYRNKTTYSKHLGCFAGSNGFYLTDSPIQPFAGPDTFNIDPVTSTYGQSAFMAMNYDQLGYEYDDYKLLDFTVPELSDLVDQRVYSERVYLAWHFRYLDEAYSVDFQVYEFGNTDEILAEGSFTTLRGVTDSWSYNGFPRHLFKSDITFDLILNNISISEFDGLLLNVEYNITTLSGDALYGVHETGVYHPFIIHHKSDGSETATIYWGNDEKYQYSNISIFISDNIDVTALSEYTNMHIIYVDEAELALDFHYRYDPDVRFKSQTISADIPNNMHYSYYAEALLSYTDYTEPETLFSLRYHNFTKDHFIAAGQNEVYKHGRNVLRSADHSKSIEIYPTISTFTKLDSYQIFDTESETADPRVALNENVFMPWDQSYIGTRLYDRIYRLDTLQTIQFFSCDSRTKTYDRVCQVDRAGYRSCDISNYMQCGNDIFGNLTSEKSYYFISEDLDKCNQGMKVGFEVSGDITGTSCTWCNLSESVTTSFSVTIDGESHSVQQFIDKDTCKATMTFEMPSDYQWVAYTFFVPTEWKMEGFAAVGVQSWDEAGWFNVAGIGEHPLQSIMQNCVREEKGGIITFKECEVQLCQEAFKYWDDKDNIEPEKEYTYRWAAYKGNLGGFTGIHSNLGQGMYRYDEESEKMRSARMISLI